MKTQKKSIFLSIHPPLTNNHPYYRMWHAISLNLWWACYLLHCNNAVMSHTTYPTASATTLHCLQISFSLFIFTCTYSSCGIMKRGCVLCAWAPDTLINTERTWRPTGPTKIILLFLYTAVQQTFILSKKWNFFMNELVQLQKKNT